MEYCVSGKVMTFYGGEGAAYDLRWKMCCAKLFLVEKVGNPTCRLEYIMS